MRLRGESRAVIYTQPTAAQSGAVRAKSDRPFLTERESTVNGDQSPYDPHSRRRRRRPITI
jgi:hypothetical protein